MSVFSNTAWSVNTTADWINVSQTNGLYNSVVTVNYSANNTQYARETVIDIFGGEQPDHYCTIVQAPMNTANDDVSIVQPLTALHGNYPNPFNPTTTISYSVSKPCMVDMNIYNIKGSLVKSLLKRQSDRGDFTVTWDGTDNSGNKVSSGIYYMHMNADKYQSYKKMMLIK